jgi:ubiquinone/menaquinone biosynthesis C-methylase UbiE
MLSLEIQEAFRRRYATENSGWRPATHVYRDLVVDFLGPGVRLLDLGCGRGGVVEELSDSADFVCGLDPDRPSLASHRVLNLPRICALSEALPYHDRSFDLVCCSWVLEHLKDPGIMLAEVYRVLAPGGRFVFVTPNRRHPLLFVNRLLSRTGGRLVSRLYGRSEEDTFPALYKANTPRHIQDLVQSCGLDLDELILVGDPSYLAFGEGFYRLACALERVTPRSMRVHLVGTAVKP